MERQTRQEYIHDLEVVQELVATMGDKALTNVEQSMKALLEDDAVLAKKVMKADDAIDDMIIDVEDKCILLIAKQQPIAHDLRVIATGFKISTDVERIGDHAFDIAKTAASVKEPLNPDCKRWIEELGNCAASMVRRAVKAYRDRSVQEADEVRKMEPNVSVEVVAALYAPTGGIVCPFGLTIALAENACDNGVEFVFNTKAEKVEKTTEGYRVITNNGVFETKYVVNAAGVYSDEIHALSSF